MANGLSSLRMLQPGSTSLALRPCSFEHKKPMREPSEMKSTKWTTCFGHFIKRAIINPLMRFKKESE